MSSLTLDAAAFPHILDNVLEQAPPLSLLAVRATSHAVCDRADALLTRHLVLHDGKISPHGLPGWHPRLRILQDDFTEEHPDYQSVIELLQKNVREIDVEDLPSGPAVDWLDEALIGFAIDVLRGRRCLYDRSHLDEGNMGYTQPFALHVEARLELHRLPTSRQFPGRMGPLSFNTSSNDTKGVFHFDYLDLTFPSCAFPLFCRSLISEAAVILHPTDVLHPAVWAHVNLDVLVICQLLRDVTHSGAQRITFVNASQLPVRAFDSVLQYYKTRYASSFQDERLHPFEQIIRAVYSGLRRDASQDKLLFLTLEEYEQRVGSEQFALEMEF